MSKKLITASMALAALAVLAPSASASAEPYFRKKEGAGPKGFDDFTNQGDPVNDTCSIRSEIELTPNQKNELSQIEELIDVSDSTQATCTSGENHGLSNATYRTYEASHLKACLS
jgi:hypothetical protein